MCPRNTYNKTWSVPYYSTHEGYRFTAIYDQENRLSSLSFTDDNGVIHETRYTYRYDSFLASIEKLENDVTSSKTQIIRNGKLALQERDGNNSVTNEYIWGKNLVGGIGGLLQLNQNGSEYFYLYDGKGNVTSVVDDLKNTVTKYKYDTFGKLISVNGALKQPFQFSTKRFDSETGLNYYGFRFYNPSIERWMNRDPLGERGGINLYAFAGSNPIRWVDPWGLDYKGGGRGTGDGGPPKPNPIPDLTPYDKPSPPIDRTYPHYWDRCNRPPECDRANGRVPWEPPNCWIFKRGRKRSGSDLFEFGGS